MQANVTGLQDILDAATLANTRALASVEFYDGILDEATTARDADAALVLANAAEIASLTAQLDAGKDALAAEIAECKGLAYQRAQAALAAEIAKREADRETADAVAADYATASAFSETGGANTICAFPVVAADAAQEPRPECQEGFCCGAAQKFLKDGTKLTVETCQNPTTRTYQYYPPLPTGATVAPEPETWRFQCISGAQKLVAAATAALAASYMMA